MQVEMHVARQRGAGLVLALFVLVVGALIGAALAPLLAGGAQSGLVLVNESRVRIAALSALDWARYRIVRTDACASGLLNLAAAGIPGVTVTVSCSSSAHVDGADNVAVYAVRAFAQAGSYGSPEYASGTETRTVVIRN